MEDIQLNGPADLAVDDPGDPVGSRAFVHNENSNEIILLEATGDFQRNLNMNEISPKVIGRLSKVLQEGCSCHICMQEMQYEVLSIISKASAENNDPRTSRLKDECDAVYDTFSSVGYNTYPRAKRSSSNYLRPIWNDLIYEDDANEGKSILETALRRKPLILNHLLDEFDDCLYFKRLERDDKETIIVADLSLFRTEKLTEIKVLSLLLGCGKHVKESILKHPLIGVLSSLKWKKFEYLAIYYFIFSVIFTALLTWFTVQLFLVECPYVKLKEKNDQEVLCHPSTSSVTLLSILFILSIILIVKLILKVICLVYMRKFHKSLRSLAELLCAANVILHFSILALISSSVKLYQLPFAAFGLLISWVLPMFHSRKFVAVGVYVETLAVILGNYAKFFLQASFLLIGFSLSYCVLMQGNSEFTVIQVLQSTIRVVTGRVGYSDFTQANTSVPFPWASFLFYFSYCITVVVVLMSILIGLAVNGIQDTKKNSALRSIIKVVNDMVEFEEFLTTIATMSWCQSSFFFILRNKLLSCLSIDCYLDERNTFELKPFSKSDQLIPKAVKKAAYKLLIQKGATCRSKEDIPPGYLMNADSKRT